MPAPVTDTPRLPTATRLGAIRLRAGDAASLASFYEHAIGLERLGDAAGGVVRLGVGGRPLVELTPAPDAPPRPPRTAGLFHLALLVPDRAELARTIERVVRGGGRFTGGSDHLVSEAMYLNDPEGNGIELYRDRPREEWRTGEGGELEMATLPIDLDGVLAEPHAGDDGMPAGTTLGHVHLNVADLAAAEAFYSGVLGFDVVVRGYPQALFVSAGGYHHHLGLNTWNGVGAPAAPAGSRGLEWFEIALPEASDAEAVIARAEAAGLPVTRDEAGALLRDPAGNGVRLVGAR